MPTPHHQGDHGDDHRPEGLSADLPHLIARRSLVVGPGMGGAALPAGTAGPCPADGTNVRAGQTVNILTEAGVLRDDIRTSIAGLRTVAEGVPRTLEITLVDVRRVCAPTGGWAVYAGQCDSEGIYSIYRAADRNYLRGVGISDASGRVRFTTVFPACYPGRWPHIHFEVFASAKAEVSGDAALLTSQFALPEAACRARSIPAFRFMRPAPGP